ncbi:hypothetical protein BDV59DRAFT_170496 [Aspergillus ambiguus]|uniref:uncharacterized protein n=1 Tax=Aspergillus ambiguus TaxID=176160 RepID=UPI003CCE2F47
MADRSHPLHSLRTVQGSDSQAAAVLSTTHAMAPPNPLTLASSHPTNPFLTGSSASYHHIQTQPHEDPRPESVSTHSSQSHSTNSSTNNNHNENPQSNDQQPPLETYPHQIGGGGPTATAPFLRDFSLVAEAAKRAQMSIMMRDLESVTL